MSQIISNVLNATGITTQMVSYLVFSTVAAMMGAALARATLDHMGINGYTILGDKKAAGSRTSRAEWWRNHTVLSSGSAFIVACLTNRWGIAGGSRFIEGFAVQILAAATPIATLEIIIARYHARLRGKSPEIISDPISDRPSSHSLESGQQIPPNPRQLRE